MTRVANSMMWSRAISMAFPWRRLRAEVTDLQSDLFEQRHENDVLSEALEEARTKVVEGADIRAQLTYHKDTLRRTRARLAGPSFHRELQAYKNYSVALSSVDPNGSHPMRQISYKLRNYTFAQSHGVAVPRVLGSWRTLGDLDLSAMPDAFVLKADGGAASDGVLLLCRAGLDVFETVDGTQMMTAAEVKAKFDSAIRAKKVYGTWFAEELLAQEGGGVIPDDVKIYVAYGRVLQILLRRVGEHGREASISYKYVDAAGEDLGAITTTRAIDPSIPVPTRLPEMVRVAQHLSRAIGVPFCRVDLYHSTRGIVLGEITKTPGGAQTYDLEHDQWMGEQWLLAKAELDLDLQHGRPLRMIQGNHPAPNLYPEGHPSRVPGSALWDPFTMECGTWC